MGVFVSRGATLAASRYEGQSGLWRLCYVCGRCADAGRREMMRVGLIGYFCSGVQAGNKCRTFEVGIEWGLMTMLGGLKPEREGVRGGEDIGCCQDASK